VKRLILSYKQRDDLDKNNRSVFYCLLLKHLIGVQDISEHKALHILSTTAVDLRKMDDLKDLPDTVTTCELARLQISSRIIKVTQNAITLFVNSVAKG